MINPYRDEAIDSLASRQPAMIGWCGGYELWVWFGKPWLLTTRTLQERHPLAFLPDLAFERLAGYTSSLDVYRGYRSRELALEALDQVRRELE